MTLIKLRNGSTTVKILSDLEVYQFLLLSLQALRQDDQNFSEAFYEDVKTNWQLPGLILRIMTIRYRNISVSQIFLSDVILAEIEM